ncbi:sigma-70 family RNA polymerase sigma factor [Streptomyces sp. NPDC005533]|uniref:sigma-70 family RNA polymerase sigma factor n=1 Tax=Streptomyces sp. NPDC005533 TaxID=3364723 RepID=UPI0036CBE064
MSHCKKSCPAPSSSTHLQRTQRTIKCESSAVPEVDGPKGSVDSDIKLIELARRGEPEAFAELFRKYWAEVMRLACSHVRDPHTAQDLAAESFVRVFQILQSGGGPSISFRGYLKRVLRNVATEWGKSARRWVAVPDVSIYETPRGDSAWDEVVNSFDRDLVVEALNSLSDRWRAVLWYTVVEGCRPSVIADHLGISPNSVSALSYRAREGLRQAYLTVHVKRGKSDASCAHFISRLAAYSRGRLVGLAVEEIERHLDACGSCQCVLGEIRDLNSVLRK